MVTTNLSEFGDRELNSLIELLKAMVEQGLPDDFDNEEVHPMMNKDSGYVFLTNSEYQVAMMNGNDLESFYTLNYSGTEGFASDLWCLFDQGEIDEKDYEQLAKILKDNGMKYEAKTVRTAIESEDK